MVITTRLGTHGTKTETVITATAETVTAETFSVPTVMPAETLTAPTAILGTGCKTTATALAHTTAQQVPGHLIATATEIAITHNQTRKEYDTLQKRI